jgi:hypothetical protein
MNLSLLQSMVMQLEGAESIAWTISSENFGAVAKSSSPTRITSEPPSERGSPSRTENPGRYETEAEGFVTVIATSEAGSGGGSG